MNTPAHLLIGTAAFGRAHAPAVTAGAVAGSLLPDLSLYLLAGGALALGIPAEVVFRDLYFSEGWQTVFAIDNSVFVWGAVMLLGLVLRRALVVALGAAALLHVGLDLPLHHDDGRPHFWPLSGWVYASPVSYWDVRHGAGWVAPIEAAAAIGCAVVLWLRHRAWRARALVALAVAAQLAVGGVWAVVFG